MSPPDETKAPDAKTEPPAPLVAFPSKLPDEWVKQLAGTAPSVWPTLLGSAVLAALLGWASSFFTARMTIQAALDRDHLNATLETNKEQARLRAIAYSNLAISLSDLYNTFDSDIVLVEVAKGVDAREKLALSNQLALVGKADAKVSRANHGPNMDSTPLNADVDSCLATLTPVLVKATSDPKVVLSQKALAATMLELSQRAQQSANAPSP